MFRYLPLLAIALVGCRTETGDDVTLLQGEVDVLAQDLTDLEAQMVEADAAHEAEIVALTEELALVTEGIDITVIVEQVDSNTEAVVANDARLTVIEEAPYATEGWVDEQGFASGEAVAANQLSIGQNSDSIATNGDLIAANTDGIAVNTGAIASNADASAINAAGISTAQSDVALISTASQSNTTAIGVNTGAIATNSTDIATNVADISANTDLVDTNSTDISSISSEVGNNSADIATNASDIATNSTDMAVNTGLIAVNNGDIASNNWNISNNILDIATNASDIATNASELTNKEEMYEGQFWVTDGYYNFVDDSGSYSLDATAAVSGDIIHDGSGMMVLDLTGTYPRLILNIDESGSIVCSLFHNEDDVPREVFYATDGGNGYEALWLAGGHTCSGGSCPDTFIIENHESSAGISAMVNHSSFYVMCLE